MPVIENSYYFVYMFLYIHICRYNYLCTTVTEIKILNGSQDYATSRTEMSSGDEHGTEAWPYIANCTYIT